MNAKNRDIKTGYDNTGGQTGLSPEEANSHDLPVPLHPTKTLGQPSTDDDPGSAIETFALHIASSLESDYGDWMREANLAWNYLSAALINEGPRVREKLELLHDMIQFNPSWKPIETCRAALILAREIRRDLGIAGDLDLHRFGIGWTESETAEIELEEASPWPNHKLPTNRTHPKRSPHASS